MSATKTLDIPGYRVLKYLGSGARSSIWSIRDQQTGQMYAIKRVVRQHASDDRFVEQAENEYEIAARLDHPSIRRCESIRRIRQWFKTREVHIIMEFCPGMSVQENRPDDINETLRIFACVAEALDHMHQRGVLHSDMKPNNIIVSERGVVKVIDLGQGCDIGTIKERIQGTPDFIAPEQVDRRPLDARTDVFNFGAALYWTLSGAAIKTVIPKTADSIALKGELNLTPVSELNPDVPPALSGLVADCVAFNPGKRPQSMQPVITKLSLVQKQLARKAEGDASGVSSANAERTE